MSDIRNSANWSFETKQLHIGQEQADPTTDARAVPIYATTSYVFHDSQHAADRFGLRDAGNIYGRLTNPTQGVFEARIAALENGTSALAVASGAAAITYTIQALAKAGEHIVASKTIYGGTFNQLEHTLPLQLFDELLRLFGRGVFALHRAEFHKNLHHLFIQRCCLFLTPAL